MGEAINHLFESELQWSFDNGIFYINGRDVICIMTGVVLGIIIVIFLQFVKEVKQYNVFLAEIMLTISAN